MLTTRAMTVLAPDARRHCRLLIPVCGRRSPLEETAMTFQTSRNDRLIEMGRAVWIARTIDPTVQFGPVTYRQFKEPVALPEQIGLTLAPRTNHQIDTFCVRHSFGRRELLHCTFEVAVLGSAHHKR